MRLSRTDPVPGKLSFRGTGLLLVVAAAVTGFGVLEAQVPSQPIAIEEEAWLSVGTASGDVSEEFYQVTNPFLLPGGNLVVPLAGYGEIRVFDTDGRLVARHGRPGDGPGEFRRLSRAWAYGDTIEAFDGQLLRITRFFPDGTFGTVRLDVAGAGHSPDSAIPGVFEDGWVLVGISGSGPGGRDEVSISHFSRNGAFQRMIGQIPGIHRDVGGTGPTPLSPSASLWIAGGALYRGETLTPAIEAVDGTGRVVNRITWEESQVSPRAALDEVVRLATERADPARRLSVRTRLVDSPIPDREPAFSFFLVDERGLFG